MNIERTIQIGTISVIISSLLLFGAVQPVVLSIEESLIIILALLSVFYHQRKGLQVDWTPLSYPFALFLLYIFFQVIPLPPSVLKILSPQSLVLREKLGIAVGWQPISLVPYRTLIQGVYWLSIFLLFLLVVNHFKQKRPLRWLINSLFYFGIAEALYGIFSFFSRSQWLLWYHNPHLPTNRVHGSYRNPDHFAGFMEMVVPIGVVKSMDWRANPTQPKTEILAKRGALLFLSMLGALALFFTLSRAGLMGFLGSMAFWYINEKRREGQRGVSFALGVLLSLLIVYAFWIGVGPMMDRFNTAGQDLRIHVWQNCLPIIKDYPLTGTGFNTFEQVFPIYRDITLPVTFAHAHNEYLEMLIEGGIIGFILFLWVFFKPVVWSINSSSLLTRASLTGIVAISIHNLFDFNLHIPGNAYLLATLFALSWIGVVTRER